VSQNRSELERSAWRGFFDDLTKEHEGWQATIEGANVDLGDQVEAGDLPFAYIEYDKDDDVIVAVGSRDRRDPAVLQHIISKPQKVLVDSAAPNAATAIEVLDAEGTQTIITLQPEPALPA
jgi:Family of unknown function (DUF5335)